MQKFNPKNKNIFILINDDIMKREDAKVSVFDSSVQGGDAVWEGLRLYDGGIFLLEKHLDRLINSAELLDFKNIPSKSELRNSIKNILEYNNMYDGVHIRLTLTRGVKYTSGMDPEINSGKPTLIILPEWKNPVYPVNGIKLIVSKIRRNSPLSLPSLIHHNNLLNNILAKIESNKKNADDAVMLDYEDFVSETNATNIFVIKNNIVFTPYTSYCLPGITRSHVIDICNNNDIIIKEKNITVEDLISADEVFVTGTMGELTIVTKIDEINLKNKNQISVFHDINILFKKSISEFSENIL